MLSIITLPAGFTDDITANASTLVNDLSSYITLIIGVILAVIVINLIIKALKD